MKLIKSLKGMDSERRNVLIKKHAPGIIANLFRYVFFLSLSYVLLYPFFYVLINSFMGITDSYDATVTWVPKDPTFGHFKNAWKVFNVGQALPNTILYELVTALIQFLTCAVAAYGMARFKFKGQSLLSGLMILNILVPAMMIIIPSYAQFSNYNLVDTPWVFYLPGLAGVGLKGGLYIYIYTQFFKGLPKELEEAAWIDGAGPWKTFLTIVLPSSGSAMITVLLFSIIWHWNDLFLAEMYLTNEVTFSVALKGFSETSVVSALDISAGLAGQMEIQILLAGCLLFLLPMIIFYLFIQRKFVASIATSGIVG